MKKLLEDKVKKIKERWSKERKEEENRKKKEDFDRLNRNWMKIQAKFRSMNHPDWMPEEEKEKKTKKKGLIARLKIRTKKWRKLKKKKPKGPFQGHSFYSSRITMSIAKPYPTLPCFISPCPYILCSYILSLCSIITFNIGCS